MAIEGMYWWISHLFRAGRLGAGYDVHDRRAGPARMESLVTLHDP